MEYLVTWEVNVDADSLREAAKAAEEIQRSQTARGGCRGVFDVTDEDGETTSVDHQGRRPAPGGEPLDLDNAGRRISARRIFKENNYVSIRFVCFN